MTRPRRTLLCCLTLALSAAAQSSLHVRVDDFGYRPLARKVAIFREPVQGYDAPAAFAPGATVEVRRVSDQSVALAGPAVPWDDGAGSNLQGQSGDRVWWFDFSPLTEIGFFVVVDPATGASSDPFQIAPDVYDQVLRQALRVFYYQRCGTPKATPHAHGSWTDGTCHAGAEQDLSCLSVLNPVPSTALDLHGGWHDAGDYNKYVNYADGAVHSLLFAYEDRPSAWADDLGIPESGNLVPDVLDEVKWELDWLLRMQLADGSVLHKLSVTDFAAASPPSADGAPRRYGPPTASATISACGVFAHGARVFASLPHPSMQTYAATLQAAAEQAWTWLQQNPGSIPSNYSNAGFASAPAEDSPYEQQMNRVCAAAYLFALTGQAGYQQWFDANYQAAYLFQAPWGSPWASPWQYEYQEGLLYYAALPEATPSVRAQIRSAYASELSGPSHRGRLASGAYRAQLNDSDHTWGSNYTRIRQGLMYASMTRHGLDLPNTATYREAAEGYLHHVHGVNPTGYTYLTNLGAYGADRSVNETYHNWFADGTNWDNAQSSLFGPAPGLLTGGPNPSWSPDPTYSGPPLVPPSNQPLQKAYLDWNTSWPQNSWSITECHIPYQAGYVRLAKAFAQTAPVALSLSGPATLTPNTTVTYQVGGLEPGTFGAVIWGLAPGSFSYAIPGWCVELGLRIDFDPLFHILGAGIAGPDGVATCSAVVPPLSSGVTFHLQGVSGAACPWPVQSAVRIVRVP